MLKFTFALFTLVSLSANVTTGRLQAGPPMGHHQSGHHAGHHPAGNHHAGYHQSGHHVAHVHTGTIHHPRLGNVTYQYFPNARYFYVPTLRQGIYLNANNYPAANYGYFPNNSAYNYSYPAPNNGLWQQNGGVGQYYDNGSSSYRNSNLGMGTIRWPGMTAEDIIGSFTN